MRILLISLYEDISSIGIRYLSSYLKAKHIQVNSIYMMPFATEGAFVNRPDSRKSVYLLKRKIGELQPDLIGIGVMTNYFKRAAALASEIKKMCATPVIFGGIHPTVCPEECLEFADIVCIGEAEETLLELCTITAYPKGLGAIRGIAYKKDGRVVKNEVRPLREDLDSFPFPDYATDSDFIISNNQIQRLDKKGIVKLLPRHIFGRPTYRIITARGCPYSCAYCCNSFLRNLVAGKGRYERNRSVDNVIGEMVRVKNDLSVESFRIMDDSFLCHPIEWLEKFGEEYKAKIGVPFSCLSNPVNVTYPKQRLLTGCGMAHMQIGLQSGSDRVNYDIYNRKIAARTFLKAMDTINSVDPRPLLTIDVILDNPLETKDDKIKTINVLKEIKTPFILGPFSLTHYPKTEIYHRAKNGGFLSEKEIDAVYNRSWYFLRQDYINGLMLLEGTRYIFPAPINFFLRFLSTFIIFRYMLGMASVFAYNKIFLNPRFLFLKDMVKGAPR
ncbi:MAG: cobalamin-dependent protein [Candidatus Omnitrophota bacterium]